MYYIQEATVKSQRYKPYILPAGKL